LRRVAPFLPVLVACAAASAWTLLSPPGANDLQGGDEGYYGTMARNVLASPAQVLSPSLSPLGPPGDKPPLYPLLIAPFVRALGATPAAVRAPSEAMGVIVAGGLGALVGLASGPATAVFASALLATLPWFADSSRSAMAELPLTALAVLALLVLAIEPRSRARAVTAGALLGLAFLCKLWLVAPPALAAVALLPWRDRHATRAFLWLAGSALVVASAHLVAVALLQPAAFAHWRYIYLSRSLAERVRGEGYADYWRLPAGAYWAEVTRAYGLVLPLVAIGVEVAWRRRAERVPRALLAWACGLVLLSLFSIKSTGYPFVIMPAFAGLAALGADAIARGVRPHVWPVVVGALLTSPPLARWGAQALPLALWLCVWVAGLALVVLARLPRVPVGRAAAAWALLAVALGTWRSGERLAKRYHTPGYERVALAIAPRLAEMSPQTPCFVAPEVPTFDFHLFRTGLYWGTPITPWTAERFAALKSDRNLRVFVVDPTRSFYGGWPDSATVTWLERNTREITRELPAGPGGERPLRVFVR